MLFLYAYIVSEISAVFIILLLYLFIKCIVYLLYFREPAKTWLGTTDGN